MNLLESVNINDEQHMLAYAAQLTRRIQFGSVVYLYGNLGAGKTTLVRGFLNALGYEGHVKSPTFTLVEPYNIDQNHIYHFDLYRLEAAEEVEMLGLRDMLDNSSILFFEWPDKAKGYLPEADFIIEIVLNSDSHNNTEIDKQTANQGAQETDMLTDLREIRLFTQD